MVCELLDDLPPAASRIFPEFRELHFWVLIVEGADSGVKRNPSDGSSGFFSESDATLLSSHCCLLVGDIG